MGGRPPLAQHLKGTIIDKSMLDRRIRAALPRSTYHNAKAVYYGARRLAGRSPGRGRTLPDFLIIGSTKCATTSLHGWLTQHPLVADTTKEIHFFDMNYYRGADWYRSHFPLQRERERCRAEHGQPLLVSEGTPAYLAHYWSPERVAKLLPDVRLIVSLREPVARTYSQYHNFHRRGTDELDTFEEALAAEDSRLEGEEDLERSDPHYHSWKAFRWGYKRTSRYAEHLERWFALFPRERFHFINFDRELAPDPQGTLARVHEFLGLPPHDMGPLPTLNAGSYAPLAESTRAELTEYFRPHNRRLYELTGIDFGWPA